jgi:acyl-CoA dehydrogenase
VERDTPRFTSNRIETLGWRTSHTGELFFEGCRVPAGSLLGEEGRGFRHIMQNFQWERISMALGAVGGMQATFDRTLEYAKEREAFGRPIGQFQAIRHKLAEMATLIEAARDLAYHGLRLFVTDQECLKEVSMAKLFCCDAAVKVADEAVQIHGGYGYMREYDVERALRDARLGPIGGGTSEIMKEIVGRQMGL